MRSNDDLYADLIEQAHQLLTTHEFNSSASRSAKLRETIYLMDAHEAGQDITLAKLAFDDDEHRCENPFQRLRLHLGDLMPDYVEEAVPIGNGYWFMPHSDALFAHSKSDVRAAPINGEIVELGR